MLPISRCITWLTVTFSFTFAEVDTPRWTLRSSSPSRTIHRQDCPKGHPRLTDAVGSSRSVDGTGTWLGLATLCFVAESYVSQPKRSATDGNSGGQGGMRLCFPLCNRELHFMLFVFDINTTEVSEVAQSNPIVLACGCRPT